MALPVDSFETDNLPIVIDAASITSDPANTAGVQHRVEVWRYLCQSTASLEGRLRS